MKLRYLFLALLASVFIYTGCEEEVATSLDNIQLSKTYLSIPEGGGTADLTINATEAWQFVQDEIPSWLTVSTLSGGAGETKLTFRAASISGGREAELKILVGIRTQFIKVRQGSMEAVMATCAQVNAGPDGKTYRVSGTVTSIVNTEYGNWYLEDATGSVYIYGTLDKNGAAKKFTSWGLEVGDVITIEGPKTTFNGTVELVDVTVLNITKSLVKLISASQTLPMGEGEFDIKVAYKGDGLFPSVPDAYRSWISIKEVKRVAGVPNKAEQNPADTAVVSVAIAENNGSGDRTGMVTFLSQSGSASSEVSYSFTQNGAIVEATVAEFLAAPVSNVAYKMTGKVKKIVNATYGNFYLEDNTGYVYVYGLTATPTSSNDKSFGSLGIKEGDAVTIIGKRAVFANAKVEDQKDQVSLAYHISHSLTVNVAEFLAAPVSTDQWYRLTVSVKEILNTTYGNIYVEDKTGYVYIYGLTGNFAYNVKTKKHVNDKKFAELGLAAGDKIVICTQRGSYPNAKVEDQKEEGLMSYFVEKVTE